MDTVLNVTLRDVEIKILGDYRNSPADRFVAIERRQPGVIGGLQRAGKDFIICNLVAKPLSRSEERMFPAAEVALRYKIEGLLGGS